MTRRLPRRLFLFVCAVSLIPAGCSPPGNETSSSAGHSATADATSAAAGGAGEPVPGGSESRMPVLTGPYLGQQPPGDEPALFAPGIVSTGMYERDVTMTPDGNEFYFGLMAAGSFTIAGTRLENGRWTGIEVAAFSRDPDVYDFEPHITPDGKRFLFLSTRPREGQEPKPGWADQDIWAADRTADGWGEPYNLGPPVCTDAPEYFPSTTLDGTIYFTRQIEEEGRRANLIFRSRLKDGAYAEPERLPEAVNSGAQQYNAFIAPDESYLIFCTAGREDGIGASDYYVAFRDADDHWTGPVNMGPKINIPGRQGLSPYVSPDGRYFFFSQNRVATGAGTVNGERRYAAFRALHDSPGNGSSDIYWVDASFIETLRP